MARGRSASPYYPPFYRHVWYTHIMGKDEEMTIGTPDEGPLPRYLLSGSDWHAREVVRSTMPHMDMTPPYQRGAVWNTAQRRALVKSWLMGVPTGVVILNARGSMDWMAANGEDVYESGAPLYVVVDGKQRLETAAAWFEGGLTIPARWLFPEWVRETVPTADGPYVAYGGLSLPGTRNVANRCKLTLVVASLPTVQAEAELYLLINGGGTPQTPQDMARAEHVAAGASDATAPGVEVGCSR
jgi:Protein of unknown function DUF262